MSRGRAIFRGLVVCVVVMGCLSIVKAVATGGDVWHALSSVAAFAVVAYITDVAWGWQS